MTSILIAVTGGSIAHTLRPLPIALRLRQRGIRVVFGGRGPYVKFLVEQGFPVIPLPMLDYARVCKMMDSERFHLRSVSEFRSAVSDQRGYLEDFQPDVILQDGPDPALPVAAFEAGIEYLNLSNATTFGLAGPHRVIPFRPWLRDIVKRSAKWTEWANYLLILQRNLRINWPIYVYLARRGIAYKQIPQSALIPDLPELYNAPTNFPGKFFIGPLLYEPEVPLPSWWSKLDNSRPIIYVGVGSSGGATGLRIMIDALAQSDYQVVLSTVDSMEAGDLPANFLVSRFVPRDAVFRRAAAVIYHGGNATTYQAIRHAVPMVAIPAHLDHDMNARAVVAQGLGVSILPHELTADGLRSAVDHVVSSSQIAWNLRRFQLILGKSRAAEQGADLLLEFARRRKKPQSDDASWVPTSAVALEEVACDLCGESENHTERQIEDVILESKQVYTVVRCKNCGLVYCSPRPSQPSLWLLEPLEQQRNCLSPARELRTIRRVAKIDLQSRVFIAGCGAGHFAQHLLDQVGCETLCVEEHPALVRRARARGLWVRSIALRDLPDDDCGFDFILFLDSLERSSSPKDALAAVRDRLARNGRVVIKTVDAAKEDAAIDVPRALYAFTANTLEKLLLQTGFAEIRWRQQGSHVWCTATPEVH